TPPRAESQWWGNDFPWVAIADMPENGHILRTTEKVSSSAVREKFGNKVSKAGTMIMSFKLTVGRVSILDIDAVHNEAIISIYPLCDKDCIIQKYLFSILPTITGFGDSKNAIKGRTLNDTSISNLLIPLPPLAEQKRIVAKIEELLPLIERYEKAWSRMQDFNKRFPGDMQKSILQMAIQGKLVEQRPEEGTGEDLYKQIQAELKPQIQAKRFKGKKLPELSADELPFDIPSSWKWVRLGDIISIESGKNLTSSQMRTGSVPVYGGNGITGYHDESLVHEETVVIGRVGFYCGSVHVTEKEAWITDNAFITTYPFKSIDRSFLVYILRHMDLGRDNNATAQPVVSGKKIYPLAFPLPPLAEQKRIVARLEELLPLCEKLK
ncbi:MAG: restriction endonuclease subunit S, partial [Lachnospiraceae bacterium]|nr:restriction endonuclease subunit S [Lachnospiraceae bacterium]